jgi:hypothetical protein
VADRRAEVLAGIRGLDGVAEGDSVFSDGPGFWAGGKQMAHIRDEGPDGSLVLEVRLTRGVIRDRRVELRADPRVTLRPSTSSDWLEAFVAEPADVAWAVDLVAAAAAAHPGPQPPPPSGPELARRRRFH